MNKMMPKENILIENTNLLWNYVANNVINDIDDALTVRDDEIRCSWYQSINPFIPKCIKVLGLMMHYDSQGGKDQIHKI